MMLEPPRISPKRCLPTQAPPIAPQTAHLVQGEEVAEDAREEGRALLQGYAMSGLLFFSLVLGAMLGSLVAGAWGTTVGCLAAPLLLVLLWWRWRRL